MNKKINSILKIILEEITLSKEYEKEMSSKLNFILEKINKKKKKLSLDVELFVGGSFAKRTLIKKDKYDIDLFLRFDKKYEEKEFPKLVKKLLKGIKGVSKIHGSRDYFQIKINNSLIIEIIPVRKIKNPKDAQNITDLSFLHVKYVNSKTTKKLLEEIKLAKAFSSATKTYGAESYIKGFSGYAIELLILHFKSFKKMLSELSKSKSQLVIDIEKAYKNKNQILIELNGSKLNSPIILIDPTYKERNATAALSEETFKLFQSSAKEFLKNPKKELFYPKKINLDEVKKEAIKNKLDFIKLSIKTKKPSGDIAGTKLLKFYNHLKEELKKYFEIKNSGFTYPGKNEGFGFFVLTRKKEIIFSGPNINDKKNMEEFKNQHKNIFIKEKKIYAKEKINMPINEFIKKWKKNNKIKIKQMKIKKIKIL